MTARNIAVIGSGISGLSAAWLLSQRHHVTLIESGKALGGHSNTVDVQVQDGVVPVDTGFIVFNNETYPNLVALFDYLKVPVVNSNMGFAVSLNKGHYEYAGDSISTLIGHPTNVFRTKHWRMVADMIRFFRTGAAKASSVPEHMTLAEFLRVENYSQEFLELHLLPVAGAIWSSAPEQMLDYPACAFLRFFENHGLLNFVKRPQWKTVSGGSREYVNRVVSASSMRVITSTPVHDIDRAGHGVVVRGANGYTERFDEIVIATHADTALQMLTDAGDDEINLLSSFKYSQNTAILHDDQSFMPKRKNLWSSWNYVSDSGAAAGQAAVTYWMNELQPLNTGTQLFVSINPARLPAEGSVKYVCEYDHPVFNPQTRAAQKQLWSLQGQNKTWFCGAHFGAGFHEDGLQSGLAVAEQLGGVKRPWNVSNESGRIFVTEKPLHAEPHRLEAAE
jgi:uncharacterized protein